jgi:fructose-specific phosphotransferase system IIA component
MSMGKEKDFTMNTLNLTKLLSAKNIFIHLKSNSKEGIIKEMIDLLADSGLITDKAAAYNAVLEREKKMSTGMEAGVAIPHGKTDSMDRLVPAIAIKKEGVDFDSVDGKPSTIFIMTISPASVSGPHIQFLAEVTQLLKHPHNRELLLAAERWEDVVSVFS